jgi:nitroimidazol reductase NimA-like FMN-containing flavoprotein (pyridoxamine 5'-phosphate oxidase superfamily)
MDRPAAFPVTPQTKVQRLPQRASYDRALAYGILDEALYASVGFIADRAPCIIPMAFARAGDQLVLHGASTSRLQVMLAQAERICVSVTLVDGVVLARSAFHHSLNYRSVVVFGRASELTAEADKRAALAAIVEQVLPGRSGEARPPSALELRATRVFALPIEEASVKCRAGGPLDDAEDLELPYWAGVIPLTLTAGAPLSDPLHTPRAPLPSGALTYARRRPVSESAGEP